MGKSKARIFRKGIIARCCLHNFARDLITMFGLSAEEILEAGASYESVIALKNIFEK